MHKFSSKSKKKLETCHPFLQTLCNDVIKVIDITIISGQRGQEEQDELYNKGASELRYPNSSHNHNPSLAVDVAPYPTDWKSKEQFTRMRELFYTFAGKRGIKLKPLIIFSNGGGDFPHIELDI